MTAIHVREQLHILLGVTRGESSPLIDSRCHSALRAIALDQTGNLRSAQPREACHILAHGALFPPLQGGVVMPSERPLGPFVYLLPLPAGESHRAVAGC